MRGARRMWRWPNPGSFKPRRWLDRAALALIGAYALIAFSAQAGVGIAGQGLDPIWAAARQRGTLRVAVDLGLYPFTWMEAGEPAGYDIDLARAIAAKLGMRAEFAPTGLDAIYDDLAARRADMAVSALPYAPELGWRARFSEFYFNAGQVLVVRDGSTIASEADVSGRMVGVALGSDADTFARKHLADGARFDLRTNYDTPDQALTALGRGELDAAIVDNTAALIGMARIPGLHIAATLTLEPYVIAVAPEAYQLHAAINQALAELRAEGFFEKTGAKWFR